MGYDAGGIADYFDELGEEEWRRFDGASADRISLAIHLNFLLRFVPPGDRVLDAGAGPGRFTIELARIGARVVVGDISAEQLRLNKEKVAEAGAEDAVEARVQLDITDLSRFDDAEFDSVVCFGGPLSYVWEQAGRAAGELVRVVKPGGHLLVSVMSTLGVHRRFLNDALALTEKHGIDTVDRIFTTGELPGDINTRRGHSVHMFRYAELEALLEGVGCDVVAASASNFLTARAEPIEPMNDELWAMLTRWELEACAAPGALDGGTHIVASARRR